MRRNACGLDRVVRLIVGLALAAVALGTSGGLLDRDREIAPWQILTAYAAGEILVTAATGWCPGSYLLGIDTCGDDRSRTERIAGRAADHDVDDLTTEFDVEAVTGDPNLFDRLRARLPVD